MTTSSSSNSNNNNDDPQRIPKRPLHNPRLSVDSVSIVGLGCSSFSTFFWSDDDSTKNSNNGQDFTLANLKEDHPVVQEWIETICYAVTKTGINLLDTAPWYGHGISETVVGFALQRLRSQQPQPLARDALIVNTKIGRYELEPSQQFDFSHERTIASVRTSLQRLQQQQKAEGGYIDVVQLHDPEFAPDLDLLFQETIPALLKCRDEYRWCKSLGMTGYPLGVQHQILQRSLEEFPNSATPIWDQSLTYAHYTLHDVSLVNRTFVGRQESFAAFCETRNMTLLSAAPLSMGLLTHQGPPVWHPASDELKRACRDAARLCQDNQMDVTHLATVFALVEPRIPCTILGIKDIAQVQAAQRAASRISSLTATSTTEAEETNDIEKEKQSTKQHPSLRRLQTILTPEEFKVVSHILDPQQGPFCNVWGSQNFYCSWDGITPVHEFWKDLNVAATKWQVE